MKRFFVFDLAQAAIIYFRDQADQKPAEIIPLSKVIQIGKEDEGMEAQPTSTPKKKRKIVSIRPDEKPAKDWEHVIEIHTPNRIYRLFSDDHNVKEQWFEALDKYLIYREGLEAE